MLARQQIGFMVMLLLMVGSVHPLEFPGPNPGRPKALNKDNCLIQWFRDYCANLVQKIR